MILLIVFKKKLRYRRSLTRRGNYRDGHFLWLRQVGERLGALLPLDLLLAWVHGDHRLLPPKVALQHLYLKYDRRFTAGGRSIDRLIGCCWQMDVVLILLRSSTPECHILRAINTGTCRMCQYDGTEIRRMFPKLDTDTSVF